MSDFHYLGVLWGIYLVTGVLQGPLNEQLLVKGAHRGRDGLEQVPGRDYGNDRSSLEENHYRQRYIELEIDRDDVNCTHLSFVSAEMASTDYI
jgi:hypothetical protein